jgi:hypothetical protein
MNTRLLQPALLWAKFVDYAQSVSERTVRRIELFIYRMDKPGAYYMNSGKLYWDEIVGDGYFSNCDQDELEKNKDVLGEVIAIGIGHERERPTLIAKSFSDFIKLLEGEDMQLTAAEQIAEDIEHIIHKAKSLGVNVFALVQKDPQGGIYYTGDRQTLATIIENTLNDLRKNEFEQDGIGSISYGL